MDGHAIRQVDTLSGEVLKARRAICIGIENLPARSPLQDGVRREGFVYKVLAPVMIRDEIAAFLEFFIPELWEPDEFILHTLDQIGSQLGRVLEHERAARDLIFAKQSAEYANRAKTEFLANMSHELRSPLTAILGFTEVMQGGLYGDLGSPKYREYADNIMKSAENLHAMINNLLDMSAIESGHSNMKEETLDLVAIINSSVRMLFQRTEAAGLTLENNVDPALPKVQGEPGV